MVTCDPAVHVLRTHRSSIGTYYIVRSPTERASVFTATCSDAFTLIIFKIPSLVSGSVGMWKCPSSLPFVMLNFTLHAAVDGESPSWTPRRNTPWLAQPSEIWTSYWERWSSLLWRKRNTVGKENAERQQLGCFSYDWTWPLRIWKSVTAENVSTTNISSLWLDTQITEELHNFKSALLSSAKHHF